jgi:hypothetical protein
MPVPQVKHAFSARERAPSQAKRRLRAKHRDRLSPFCTSRYLGLRGPCSFRGAAVARFYLGRSVRTFMTIVRTAPHMLLSLKKEGPTEQKPGLRAESRPPARSQPYLQTPLPKLPQAITEGSSLRYRPWSMINVARLLSVILLTRKLLLFLLLGAACASSSGSGGLQGAGVTTTIGSVSHPGTDDHYHRQPHQTDS